MKAAVDFQVNGKIALIDADLLAGGTRHPNLALMKISGYLKARGCDVHLIEDYAELGIGDWYDGAAKFERVYISKAFDFSEVPQALIEQDNVYVGGTGFYFDAAPPPAT